MGREDEEVANKLLSSQAWRNSTINITGAVAFARRRETTSGPALNIAGCSLEAASRGKSSIRGGFGGTRATLRAAEKFIYAGDAGANLNKEWSMNYWLRLSDIGFLRLAGETSESPSQSTQ